MATVFRPPIIIKFQPLDPAGISARSEGEVWENRLENLLQSQDQFFGPVGMGPNYDWPNPRGAIYPISLRTHTDSYKLTLIGQDSFYGAPGESKTYDWPNPIRPPKNVSQSDYSLAYFLGYQTIPSPFFQIDWPNPKMQRQNQLESGQVTGAFPLKVISKTEFINTFRRRRL